jgi:hypothetical protein
MSRGTFVEEGSMSRSVAGKATASPASFDGALARGREGLAQVGPKLAHVGPKLAVLGGELAHRLHEVGKRALGGSPILRQGLAALERGNLEAAFWLLREEVGLRPDGTAAVQAFWEVAVACGRPEAAAGAMSRRVRAMAVEDPDRAAQAWIGLDAEAPDAPVDALTLARILPVLKERAAAARSDEAREEARRPVLRALRRCVEPGSGLEGGVAYRIVEEARELDPEVARRAAEIALESPHLHEAKRARLEAVLGREPAA